MATFQLDCFSTTHFESSLFILGESSLLEWSFKKADSPLVLLAQELGSVYFYPGESTALTESHGRGMSQMDAISALADTFLVEVDNDLRMYAAFAVGA